MGSYASSAAIPLYQSSTVGAMPPNCPSAFHASSSFSSAPLHLSNLSSGPLFLSRPINRGAQLSRASCRTPVRPSPRRGCWASSSSSSSFAGQVFSRRNLVPRLLLRTLYLAFCAMATMLPFFGDIVSVVGAVGFIPLDFVLPVVMYNIALAPLRRSPLFLANMAIMVVFTGVGAIGAFASIWKLVLDAGQFKLSTTPDH